MPKYDNDFLERLVRNETKLEMLVDIVTRMQKNREDSYKAYQTFFFSAIIALSGIIITVYLRTK